MTKPKDIQAGMRMARKVAHDALGLCPPSKRKDCAWCCDVDTKVRTHKTRPARYLSEPPK